MKRRLFEILNVCNTEEEVKSEFAKYFKFKIDTKQRFDHYSEQVLYEFKYTKNLNNPTTRAKVIAQTLYYIRFLKYGNTTKPVPPIICVVDKDEAFTFPTMKYKSFYSVKKKYDWDRAASIPCPKLVNDILRFQYTKEIHTYNFKNKIEEERFIDKLTNYQSSQISFFDNDRKEITENNFLEIYEYWYSLFGRYVENGHKASEYFISDIEKGKSNILNDSELFINMGDGNGNVKNVPMLDYQYFWNTFDKIDDTKTIYAIRQKMDRISENYQRRFTGEFYTPIDYANKALEYIERTIGSKWYEKDNWRLWDMAAGTGNLEFALPTSALKNCYISTLLLDDAKYCQRIFPTATCFQYDYLNDDINLLEKSNQISYAPTPKMPQNLQNDLENPDIKWIILINPPFATSNTVGTETGKKSKNNVSMTKIRQMMDNSNLGEASRELYAQFLYRISKEFNDRTAYLGLFSKLKYINSNNDQLFRDKIFNYRFERGMMFSSEHFHGSKGKFPVGFLIWNLGKRIDLQNQNIMLDVYNNFCEKYATKIIMTSHRNSFLSKWAIRTEANIIMPPFKSAIEIGGDNKDIRDRVSKDFICSLMCNGNDFQHLNQTALLSGPYVSAGAYSVVPCNFEKSMIIHAVRRLLKADWTNDRDQLSQPNIEPLPSEFVHDCIIWSVFSDSNNTVSLKNVEYKDKKYQIQNNLYPFTLEEIKGWRCSMSDIALQIAAANENRFFATWLTGKILSNESKTVIKNAKKLYMKFYENLNRIPWMDYKISFWDVGLWQVKAATKDRDFAIKERANLRDTHKILGEKILPQLYQYGFIPPSIQPLSTEEAL